MEVFRLFGSIFIKDEGADRKLDEIDRKAGGLGGTLGKLGKVALVAGAAVATAIGAVAVKGITSFIGFEKQMNEVFTLLPGISDKAMKDMTGQVKDFSKEFGTLPEEVVPALYQSISAGVPKENVFSFLEVAQKAAVGGVTELETAVDGISSVVNAYGSDVIDAGKASDLMFTAVRMGKTTFGELSSSLFQVIPSAAALGVKFGDVTAAIASMTAQGTPTSVATTQMRQMLVELSKAGGETADTFEQIAGKSFKQFIKEGGNTSDALNLLAEHAEDTGVGVNDLFGSVEAGNAALALTGKGASVFAKNLEEMENSAGATDGAYAKMEEGLGRSFDKIKAAGAVLLLDIGEKLAPGVAVAAQFIQDHMGEISAFIDQGMKVAGAAIGFVSTYIIPAAITAFGLLQAAAGWLGDHLLELEPIILAIAAGFATWAIIQTVTAAVGLLTYAVETLSTALAFLAANPVVLIVAAIVGLIAVTYQLITGQSLLKAAVDTVSGSQDAQAAASKRAEDALRTYQSAVDASKNADLGLQQAKLSLEQAQVAQKKAQADLTAKQQDGTTSADALKDAELRVRQADIDVARSSQGLTDAEHTAAAAMSTAATKGHDLRVGNEELTKEQDKTATSAHRTTSELGHLGTAFSDTGGAASRGGKSISTDWVGGITGALWGSIGPGGAITKAISAVKKFFGGSLPELGPLSGGVPAKGGRDIARSWLDGINNEVGATPIDLNPAAMAFGAGESPSNVAPAPSKSQQIEVHLHIDQFFGDDSQYKKLENKLRGIRIEENMRLGLETS